MLAITAGDHAAARFDTALQFATTTIAFTHRALAQGAQVMVIPDERQLATAHHLVTGAATEIWQAVGDGQVRFADARTLRRSPDTYQVYAELTHTAVDSGYSGLWVSVDMSWAADSDSAQLTALEAGAYGLFAGGQLTALCQYPSASFTDAAIRAACQAHPANSAGVRVRHEFSEHNRRLRLWGETDQTNAAAFAVLVSAVAAGGTIDVTGMSFIGVRGLLALARSTRSTPPTAIVCTANQARYLRTMGAALV